MKWNFKDLRPMKIERTIPKPSGTLYYMDLVYGNPYRFVHSDGTIVLKQKRNRKPKIIIL